MRARRIGGAGDPRRGRGARGLRRGRRPRRRADRRDLGRIVLSINDGGFSGVYAMRADGSRRRRLTPAAPKATDATGHTAPAWSPDGRTIACQTRLTSNNPDLWEGRADWDPTSRGGVPLRC